MVNKQRPPPLVAAVLLLLVAAQVSEAGASCPKECRCVINV